MHSCQTCTRCIHSKSAVENGATWLGGTQYYEEYNYNNNLKHRPVLCRCFIRNMMRCSCGALSRCTAVKLDRTNFELTNIKEPDEYQPWQKRYYTLGSWWAVHKNYTCGAHLNAVIKAKTRKVLSVWSPEPKWAWLDEMSVTEDSPACHCLVTKCLLSNGPVRMRNLRMKCVSGIEGKYMFDSELWSDINDTDHELR